MMKPSPCRIFLSSTTRDLADYRDAVEQAIKRTEGDYVCVRCEDWGARPDAPASFVPEKVRDCGLLILLVGQMYGSTPPDSDISFTELEYETALEADISVLPFLIHPEVYPRGYRPEPEAKRQRLEAFRRRVEQAHGRAIFEKPDDLEVAVLQALRSWERDQMRTRPALLLGEYRAYLRRLYADLPLAGIPVPLDVTMPLDRVYIKLRALPERQEAARREAELPPDRDEELPRRLGDYLWRRREKREKASRHQEGAQAISPEEAIARQDRLAILGDAGAGKSTLLRHLAWEWAGVPEALLPLLIPLGRADTLISQTGCSFLEAALNLLAEHKANEEKRTLKQVLADAIGDKLVLLLCDGLDEAHLARRSVIVGLEKLAADGHHLVVTSRPLGYERLAALEHFQVLPLLPEDAKAFSDRWFRALAEVRGVPEPEQERWATEGAGWLQGQLRERSGLREVARNPLLLTFLAVLAGDEPQRDLPQRRKELYREYVERLFTVWEARRRREGKLALEDLSGEKARRVALWGLYRTAWHLHRAYYGEEGLRAVRDEIESLLARDLRERWGFGLLQAESLAVEVLRFWRGAGMLDAYRLAGQEWLAFRHLTFQEYGAARALAETHRDDAGGLWQCLSPHLLRPQWAGVTSLTLALLPGAQATTMVKRLLKVNKKDKDRQRPLFLAAAALAEGAEVADAPHRQVVDALLDLARTWTWWEWQQRANSEDAINALGRLVGDGHAVAALLAIAQDWNLGETVQILAAEALGRMGCADKATELLLAIAGEEPGPEWMNQLGLAIVLGRLGRDELVKIMSTLSWDQTVRPWVRRWAVEVLGELGQADALLLIAREQTADFLMRIRAVTGLGELGKADNLVALARDQRMDDQVRAKAAAALERVENACEATELLLALARDQTVGGYVQAEAAATLGEMGRVEEAAECLLALARDRVANGKARGRAAEELEKLGQTDEAAEGWLYLARDRTVDNLVRQRAVAALAALGRADDLLALAQDRMVESWVQVLAAAILGELGQAMPEVLVRLLALAEEFRTPESVRWAARRALRRLEK
jgi:hypothetical protein